MRGLACSMIVWRDEVHRNFRTGKLRCQKGSELTRSPLCVAAPNELCIPTRRLLNEKFWTMNDHSHPHLCLELRAATSIKKRKRIPSSLPASSSFFRLHIQIN